MYSEIGHGTSFKIYLPVAAGGQRKNYGQGDIPEIQRGKGKILVIDDETTVGKIAADFLEECGYTAIQAESISEAIDIFGKIHKEINAVLLDLSMPGTPGKDVFLMLKKIEAGVRVLLTSGFRKDDRVDELFGMGIKGFIQKPMTIEKLSEAINFVIHSL